MINILLNFLSIFFPEKAYLVWKDKDSQETTYWGPFNSYEAFVNMDDAYGSLLQSGGDSLEIVELTWVDVKILRRNKDFFTLWYPAEFWYEQRYALEDEDTTPAWETQARCTCHLVPTGDGDVEWDIDMNHWIECEALVAYYEAEEKF